MCRGDLWIDIETRLILRTQGPAVDDAGQPIPVESTEVTEIAFGEQPAALFEPPEGVARMSEDEYSAYICARDLPNELVPRHLGLSDCGSGGYAAARAEPDATPMPTVRPDASDCAVPPGDPSEPTGPLAWTPERLKEDWPAPVRPEPAGGASVQPIPLTYGDLIGDNGSTAFPCADIRGVMADTGELHLKLVSSQPVVAPADAWIAYGVVIDDDRDGVPDWRYGIDNTPVDRAYTGPHTRVWRTDLHTGQTDAGPELIAPDPPPLLGRRAWAMRGPRTEYPRVGSDAGFRFSGGSQSTNGSRGWGFELDMPFYAWASVIVDGRVVATDYAPDTGWLVATRDVWPGGTLLVGDPFPHLSMTVPEGWTRSSTDPGSSRIGAADMLKRVTCGDPRPVEPGVGRDDFHCATVRLDVIDDPEEYCDDAIAPPFGSSFDDLVTYFAALPGGTSNADVTVDGYRGKHLEYSPDELEDGSSCHFSHWSNPDYWIPSDVWILDVDGVHLMIGSEHRGRP